MRVRRLLTVVAVSLLVSAAPASAVDGSGVIPFGNAADHGSMRGTQLNQPAFGVSSTSTGQGYWFVAVDGGIFSFGDAQFYGSTGSQVLPAGVVGMATTPSGQGYWMFGSDGAVYAFGDAPMLGSMSGTRLNQPVITGSSTSTGLGYWMFAEDGGVFTFGDAGFFGSLGGDPPDSRISGMAVALGDQGYWLVTEDGEVYPFGSAVDHGDGVGKFERRVIGIARTPSGGGYWLADASGRVLPFGDAGAFANAGSKCLTQPASGIAARPQADGGWLVTTPIPPAATAGIHPVDQVRVESAQMAEILQTAQTCQAATPEANVRVKLPVTQPRITSAFGDRIHPIYKRQQLHSGTDYVGTSTNVYAALDGTVIDVRDRVGYGKAIIIDHGGRVGTVYAHLSKASVKVGDVVKAGQVIGVMGRTGFATGVHLHFEVRLDGIPIDPQRHLG